MSRQAAEKRGRRAEWLACLWLRLHGWRIIGHRLRTRVGEVDIVARRGRLVIFVEVKARASQTNLDMAIDIPRLKRVAAATNLLTSRFVGPDDDCRIDVILITPWRWPHHIENVWIGQ